MHEMIDRVSFDICQAQTIGSGLGLGRSTTDLEEIVAAGRTERDRTEFLNFTLSCEIVVVTRFCLRIIPT